MDRDLYELMTFCSDSVSISDFKGLFLYSKNSDKLMFNPIQIFSKVGIEGHVFRLKMLFKLE